MYGAAVFALEWPQAASAPFDGPRMFAALGAVAGPACGFAAGAAFGAAAGGARGSACRLFDLTLIGNTASLP